MTDLHTEQPRRCEPAILPEAARNYLAHTTQGRPIRELAREAGCHPSTILRQVRKLENLRDDPLVDCALAHTDSETNAKRYGENSDKTIAALRKLCAERAMLLYSRDLPRPAIIQAVGEGDSVPLGVVDLDIAASLVMHGWIAPDGGTSVRRYRITAEGRSYVQGLIAAQESRRANVGEDGLPDLAHSGPDRRSRDRSVPNGPGSDNPVVALSRRRGPDGKPFLPPEFVAAGDRLYEDFAIAGLTLSDLAGWESGDTFGRLPARLANISDPLREQALDRTLEAIKDLGPSLGEIALRCCCLREGLEATERRLGWSARSGKVVLRIALQRLHIFYTCRQTHEAGLIG